MVPAGLAWSCVSPVGSLRPWAKAPRVGWVRAAAVPHLRRICSTAGLGAGRFAPEPAAGQKGCHSTFASSFTSAQAFPGLGAAAQPTTVGSHPVLWREAVIAIYPD